jgi:hypothetical protein
MGRMHLHALKEVGRIQVHASSCTHWVRVTMGEAVHQKHVTISLKHRHEALHSCSVCRCRSHRSRCSSRQECRQGLACREVFTQQSGKGDALYGKMHLYQWWQITVATTVEALWCRRNAQLSTVLAAGSSHCTTYWQQTHHRAGSTGPARAAHPVRTHAAHPVPTHRV